MTIESKLNVTAWAIAGTVSAIAIIAWGSNLDWDLSTVGGYEIFPLLGLLAFGLMWSHYIVGVVRRWQDQQKVVLKDFFRFTSYGVLALILLHPLIFQYMLLSDGFGFPPASYQSVYPDAMAQFALMLGTVSLIAFLAYELRRKFSTASWWKYIEYANIAAMFLILYHGLSLGGDLMEGWYRLVWLGYAFLLIFAIGFNYKFDKGRQYEA